MALARPFEAIASMAFHTLDIKPGTGKWIK
jgi:hypothetical protein